MEKPLEELFSPRQVEFIKNSKAKFNLAHGSVRSGKTVCTLFKFIGEALLCPGPNIVIFGYSQGTIYNNVVSLLLNSEQFLLVRSKIHYQKSPRPRLILGDKEIKCIGAGDEGTIGDIQGITLDLCYCDEFTLYPENLTNMIKTRLSKDHSKLYASMNPKQPTHLLKDWIDRASHDPLYYELHFSLDHNPYLPDSYKEDLKSTLSGLFYKRYYLGMWCLAEGAVYEFFDKDIHVVSRPPRAAEYWIAGIDVGTANPFACVLIGVNTGRHENTSYQMWVEDEYYWDPNPAKNGRRKTMSEFMSDVQEFLSPYFVKGIYVDPSAAAFKEEMRRGGMHPIDANNDVIYGIEKVAREMQRGNLVICDGCENLISEIERYVWDSRKTAQGKDEPLKKHDHACLTKDVEVETREGRKKINEIKAGDEVLGWDGKALVMTLVLGSGMTKKAAAVYEIELENGYKISATEDHKFYTKEGYKELKDLTLKDSVVKGALHFGTTNLEKKSRISPVKIKSIRKLDEKEDVYCLATQTKNFFANEFLVHNCDALRYALATHRVVTRHFLDDYDSIQNMRSNF